MTDFQEPQLEGTESLDGSEQDVVPADTTPKHVFNEGDQGTIVRGRHRGQKATVVRYSPTAGTYVVELDDKDGTLIVINVGNLRAPQDSTISVRALVQVMATFQDNEPDEMAMQRLATALDKIAPEVSVKLNEAMAT
jgi:hypothetical protein